ncbi:MAG: hypothetical protein J6D11_08180 [Clostridia bacterium]|nr:hypothetical protein [Clostridia bacterium]
MSRVNKIKRNIKNIPRPPLSPLDKFTYFFMIAFLSVLWFALIYSFAITIPMSHAFSYEGVVAAVNGWGILFVFPLEILIMVPVIAVGMSWQKKQPIFGNKKFYTTQKFKAMYQTATVHPIFSEEFKKNLPEKKKRSIKRAVCICLVLLVVFSLLSILGICPRYVLDENNNILKYNSFDKNTATFDITDADKVIIGIDHINHKGKSRYYVQIQFVFDDDTYTFSEGSFCEMNTEEMLHYMLYLKSIFLGRCEIIGQDNADRIILRRKYTAAEASLLYELLDLN